MWNYRTQYQSCHCWISGPKCGDQYGIHSLFTATELHSCMRNIYGYMVSDYVLIKSRCWTFQKNFVLCPLHRYLLCEGYVSEMYCMCYRCHSRTELMQMGARAALFIGNVPIRKYMYIKIIGTSSNDFLFFCFSWLYL